MAYFVYIIKCADGTLYTGYTTDINNRLRVHNGETGKSAAARYTRGRRPVILVYQEECATRGEALSREHAIKQLTKSEKEALIAPLI